MKGGVPTPEALETTTEHRQGQGSRPSDSPDTDLPVLASGAGFALVGRVAGRGVHVAAMIILGRTLGPEAFGLYGLGWTIFRLLTLLLPIGTDLGVIRFGGPLADRSRAGFSGLMVQALCFAVGTGTVVGAALFMAAPAIGDHVFAKGGLAIVLRVLALAVPAAATLRVAAAASRAGRNVRYSIAVEDIGQPLVNLVLVIAVVAAGASLGGAVAALDVSFLVAVVAALLILVRFHGLGRGERGTSPVRMTELLKFGAPASLAGIFGMLLLWTDRLMVGYFRPAFDLGIYQAASQVSILFVIVLSGFGVILSPMVAGIGPSKEKKRLEALFRLSTRWCLTISLPIALVIFVAPRNVLTAFFGEPYGMGAATLVILVAGQLANVASGAAGPFLVMTGGQRAWFVVSGLALAANVGLNLVLIPQHGIQGAAAATAISASLLSLAGLAVVRRRLGIAPFDFRVLKAVVATGAGALAATLLHGLTGSFFADWVPCTLAAVGIYVVTLIALGIDADDRALLVLLRSRTASPLTRRVGKGRK
jgi:O-antigen/teichoic acid export membrane protein